MAPNIPRVSSTRPLVNAYTPPIPQPAQNGDNLLACVVALKAGVESLIGQRGDAANRAVTFHDLVGFGLLEPQAVTSPNGSMVLSGVPGPPGPPGEEGPAGPVGPAGASISAYDYSYNDTTTAPPGGGQVRFNNVNQTLATIVWISNITAPGVDITHLLDTTITATSRLVIQDKDNSTRYQRYQVTGAPSSIGAYQQVPVTWLSGGTALPSGQRVLLAVMTGNPTITLSSDVTGSGTTSIPSTVVGLQGRPVVNTAPTVNQALSWNGSAWAPATVSGGSGNYVLKSGDTMSGNLTIGPRDWPALLLQANATTGGQLIGYRGTSLRWAISLPNSGAESSGNAGSDFAIDRYSDSAGYLGTALAIYRATGNAVFQSNLTLGSFYLSFAGASPSGVNGTGGPFIYADANTMVFKLGSNTNGFWWQNYNGTIIAKITGDLARLQMFQPANTANYVEIFNDGNAHIESNTQTWINGNTSQPTIFGGSVQSYQTIRSRPSGTVGWVGLSGGTGTGAGYVEWYRPDATTRIAYMGWNDSGANNLNLTLQNGAQFYIRNGNLCLDNNYGYNGRDTAGNQYFCMGLLNDNKLWIGDGTHAINFQSGGTITWLTVNSTLTANAGLNVSGGNLYSTNQIWCDDSILCGNDRWYYGRTNGNNYYDILGCVGNLTYVGNAAWDTRMRAASSVWTQCHIAPLSNNTYYCGHSGSLWYQVQSYSFYNPSDISLKHDIAEAPSCLDVVRALKPKTYKYNDGLDDRTHWGFVAQDVAHEMREAGHTDFGGHIPVSEMNPQEGLAYHELTAVLWRAVQELAAKLEARDG